MKLQMKILLILALSVFFSCKNSSVSDGNDTENTGMLLKEIDSNQYTGKIVKYYLDVDQKKYEELYKNGNKNGSYYSWFKNGKVKVHGRYSNNKRVGVWKWFKENGELQYAFVYKC